MKLYMFQTVPLSIISSYSLYTQQWYMSYRFVDNFPAGSGWNSSSFLILLDLLELLEAHPILHVSRIRVKSKLTGERSETYPYHQYLSVSSHSLLVLCKRKWNHFLLTF
jgi:hypothetical protein